MPAGKEGGPGGLPSLPKEEEKHDEEKKDDYVEKMEGKRRVDEDMPDSLVVEEGICVKFPLVPFASCLLTLKLLLQGSFKQEHFHVGKIHENPTS